MVKHSLKVGLSFGSASGIITTLGLMVGLHASTHSRLTIIGGILTIAIADAFSDALGIHIAEEAENKHTTKQIWVATLATFFAKLGVALTFAVPVLLLELGTAIVVSIAWGLSLLGVLSYGIARGQKAKPWRVIGEHLLIGVGVILLTHYVGHWIASVFG